MWLKKIKNKKMQMFLIGLVLCAVSLLFSMCLSYTIELADFSKKGINKDNCPDTFVIQEGALDVKDSISDDDVKDNIKSVSSLEGKTISAPITINGKDISMYNNMMLSLDKYDEFGYFKITEGSKYVSKGEILIPKVLAKTNDIDIGDTITIEYNNPVKLKVAGIYISTLLPKPIVYSPIIASNEDISELDNEKDASLSAVYLNNDSKDKIEEMATSDKYCARSISRESLQNTFTEVSSILGSIGAMSSFLIFIVALIIIKFIITTNLTKEFKSIGIYKSLGYPSKKIVGFYLKGYLLVGSIFIILGSLLSLPLTYALGISSTEYIEGFKLSGSTYLIIIIAIVFLMILLSANVLITLRKVKKISPVEAVNIGMTLSSKRIKDSIIKNAKSPIAVAINEMNKNKRSTIVTILVLSISMMLSMLFVKLYYSSDKMIENSNMWFGIPKNTTYISGNISDELLDYLDKDDMVKSSVYGEISYSGSVTSEKFPESLGDVRLCALNDLSEETTKIPIQEGRSPKHEDEIVMTRQLIKKINMKVGDYISIAINNKTSEYLITGSFDSMMNDGNYFMIFNDAVEKVDSNNKYSRCFVTLKNKDDYDDFKDTLEDKFDGISVDKEWLAVDNAVEAIQNILRAVSLILVVLFITFSILNVVIVVLIDNNNKSHRYGILKSLGFTTGYLIRQNLCKYLLMTFISIFISSTVHLMFSRKFCAAILIDAFVDSNILLGGLITGFVGLIIISILIISLSIRKISPVQLMEE